MRNFATCNAPRAKMRKAPSPQAIQTAAQAEPKADVPKSNDSDSLPPEGPAVLQPGHLMAAEETKVADHESVDEAASVLRGCVPSVQETPSTGEAIQEAPPVVGHRRASTGSINEHWRGAASAIVSRRRGSVITASEISEQARKATAGSSCMLGSAGTFGTTPRKLSDDPCIEKSLCPVHIYTDPNKTSFLSEVRGGASFSHKPHVPRVPQPPAPRNRRRSIS